MDMSPFSLGYRMPAEWEKHEATWLAWPKNPNSFPGKVLAEVEVTFLRIIEELSRGERVGLLVDSKAAQDMVMRRISSTDADTDNIAVHMIPTGDIWFRDFGPIFVSRSGGAGREIGYTHWRFNAWGNKYDEIKPDTHVPEKMPLSGFRKFEIPMVLEGGSIDTNGKGTFLTTEQCLLNRNRNPHLSRMDIETYLREYLGDTNTVWLKEGIEGDDTDGHVDDIARFVSHDTVACAYEEDADDENHAALAANFELLCRSRGQDGNFLKVVRLPMPGRMEYEGSRLPASYANFYIANEVVLVPTFEDENDGRALGIIRRLFPGRKVVGIDCRAMIVGFGAIHCATQQQPAGKF